MSGLTNLCYDTFTLIAWLLPAALGGRYELFSFCKGATWRLQNDDPRLLDIIQPQPRELVVSLR